MGVEGPRRSFLPTSFPNEKPEGTLQSLSRILHKSLDLKPPVTNRTGDWLSIPSVRTRPYPRNAYLTALHVLETL